MTTIKGRALHYVFKIIDRKETINFFKNILGMTVLRHEEFTEGCEAQCNGPYANRWSKTMIGYGPEDDFFVLELTYNYGIKHYEMGNDFNGIVIRSGESLLRARTNNWPILSGNILEAPGGYKFYIIDQPQNTNKDPIEKVILASSNIETTRNYWNTILGLTVFEQSDKHLIVGFQKQQAQLEFKTMDTAINRAGAYGRVAFACPYDQQPLIESNITKNKEKILTPLISLDTPGKATVRVIILADPDGHEICFVDDENFRKLSVVDPKADELLEKYIRKDFS